MSIMSNASHRLADIARGLNRRNRERAARAALERMSESQLRDIGLDRADIRRAIHHGGPRRW